MNENYKFPEGGLLQSKEWADVLRAEGKEVIEISCDREVFFGTIQKLPIVGKYVYFPRMYHIGDDCVKKLMSCVYGWIRVDIVSEKDMEAIKRCGKKIEKAPHDMQPKEHLIIDLTQSEEGLLAQMKSKTRYNVRLAQKKGVKVFASREKKYLDVFYDLVTETAQRKKVVFHEKAHYEKMFSELSDDMIMIYIAEYDGEVIAANLISFYGNTATYLHGATADTHRNVMAPFLLQWQAMQDAKARGCCFYDFGGVFPESDDPGKKGITRFKKGFAPRENLFVTKGSYDIVLSAWRYRLYRMLQKLR